MSNGLTGNTFTRNIWIHLDLRSSSHEELLSTLFDLCPCKVWICYSQWLRRCITKKIHYLTLTPRSRESVSHEMLPSTLDIVWSMHQQSLMLLHHMVKDKMHLKENTLFDLDKWIKATRNVAQYPTSCDLCTSKFWYCFIWRFRKRCIYNKIYYYKMLPSALFIMWPKYAPTEFEVTTSKVYEEKHLQENSIFDLWHLTLGSRSHEMLPSTLTSCDLFSYKVRTCCL